ncbi:MAG: hypothetical protein PHH58_16130, partial [Rhodoferax sp.]|nr:hypothetical protein [Rhodoferax sp.]
MNAPAEPVLSAVSVPQALTLWNILDLAHFRIYVVDVLTFEVIYANAEVKAQEGYDPSQSNPCYQLIYQHASPCLSCKMAALADAASKGAKCSATYERSNEPADAWFQIQEGILTLPDGRTAMYSIANDISAIKEMQNNLAEA